MVVETRVTMPPTRPLSDEQLLRTRLAILHRDRERLESDYRKRINEIDLQIGRLEGQKLAADVTADVQWKV